MEVKGLEPDQRSPLLCLVKAPRYRPNQVKTGSQLARLRLSLDLKPAQGRRPLDVRNVIGNRSTPGYRKCPLDPLACSSDAALHDLTAGVGGALPVEASGDSLDLEAGGAGAPHLRLEGTGRHRRPSIPVHDLSSLWKFAPPPTSVIAVNPTVEER